MLHPPGARGRSRPSARAGAVASLLCACQTNLGLPQAPRSDQPIVTSFEPAAAFAGAPLVVRGRALGTDARETEVRVGGSSPVHPTRLAPDGTSLELVVPDDATGGPVVVSTGSGRATASTDFVFSGLGRLRNRRLVDVWDLRPLVDAAFPIGRDVVALWMQEYGRAAVRDAMYRTVLLPPVHVVAAAGSRTADRVALLALEPVEPPCDWHADPECDFWAASVLVYDDAALRSALDELPAVPEVVRFRAPNYLQDAALLALAPDGATALVAAGPRAWLLDVPGGTVRDAGQTGAWWSAVAAAGPGRFVLAEGTGIRLLDAASALPGESMDVLPPEAGGISALASDDTGRIAAGGVVGHLAVVDDTGSATPRVQVFGPDVSDFATRNVAAVAFSDDGERLAALLDRGAALVTYDLTHSPPRVLGAVPLEDPRAVAADRFGHFVAAVRGGVSRVATQSGMLVDRRPLDTRLHSPHLRTVVCAGEARQVLEVAVGIANAVVRLSPSRLDTIEGCPPIELVPTSSVVALAAAPRRDVLYALLEDGQLWRFGGEGGAPTGPWRERDPLPSVVARSLLLSPDGNTLAVKYPSPETGGGSGRTLAFPGLNDVWYPGVETPTVPVPSAAFRVHLSNRRLVETGLDSVRILDLAQARRGVEQVVAEVPLDSDGLVGAEVSQDWLVAVRHVQGDYRARLVDLEDGTAHDTVPFPGGDSMIFPGLTPGGRHLWWLGSFGNGYREEDIPIRPETGELGVPGNPMPVLDDADEAYWYPDGEHLVVVEWTGGRIALYE